MLHPARPHYVYGIHSHAWFNGKEVFTAVLCEYYGLPYLGPPPTVRAVSEDKKLAKLLAAGLDIPIIPHVELAARNLRDTELPDNAGPWILKPRNGIASQHVHFCKDRTALQQTINLLSDEIWASTQFIVEPFISGQNLAAPIIENVDPASLDVFEENDGNPQNILTFESKRGVSGTYESKPYEGVFAPTIKKYVKQLESELQPYDYGRLDFRCDPVTGVAYFLEANLICNMSERTVVAKAAKRLGADYATLIEHVLATSIRRQREKFSDLSWSESEWG